MGGARQSDRWLSILRGHPAVAWLCWATLIVTVSILILFGSDRTVLPAYRDAAQQWFAGRDIYATTGHGFLYLPSAALLFAPFGLLPFKASEILWRVLMIGSFALGVRRLSDFAGRGCRFDLFPLMTLAALLPALACARNGQSTLIMTATMMLAIADLADGHRGRSALWMSLSLAFKPLTAVMILLVAALDRRMAWRLFVGVALVLLVPFLTQTPHYVTDQYVKSLQMFRASSLCGMNELWAQPFSVLSLMGITVSEPVQTLIRAGAAVATLVLCFVAQRRSDFRGGLEYLFAFSVLYILLFNPRSENNTYAMLGPTIGLFAAPWIATGRRPVAVAFLSLLLFGLAAGDELVRVVSTPGEHIWLKPSLGVAFLLFLIGLLLLPQGAAREPVGVVSASDLEIARRPVLATAGTTDRQGAFLP